MNRVLVKFSNIKKRIICSIKSYFLSKKVDEGNGKFIIKDSKIKVNIRKREGAKLQLNGNVIISSHSSSNNKTVTIVLGRHSVLKIKGDFTIGNDVKIHLSKGAQLSFGGKLIESASGITADTFIMVNKKIEIGTDFLCAWGVFITDSDWHQIEGQPHQADVLIGNHVWIANNSSILKGTVINDNCIVASNSKLINKTYPSDSMIAGSPARVVKSDINWSRDIE